LFRLRGLLDAESPTEKADHKGSRDFTGVIFYAIFYPIFYLLSIARPPALDLGINIGAGCTPAAFSESAPG
jgi:hypothetical protein